MVLSAVDTYTGTTTVQSGTLLVDGSIAGSTTTVGDGGTLGGSGSTGAVTVDGTISASAKAAAGTTGTASSIGMLTTGALTLDSGATFREDLTSTTAADLVKAGGAVTVGGTIDLKAPSAFTTAAGQIVTLIDNTSASATTGIFADLVLNGDVSTAIAANNTFTDYGRTYQINYNANVDRGTAANDVTVTDVTPSPPSGGGSPAPSPVAPTITGTHASTDTAEGPVMPFSGVTVTDANANPMDSLAITLSGGGGTLTGNGLTGSGTSYMLAATDPTTLTGELDALSFVPTAGTPGVANPTTFSLADTSNAGTMAADSGTTVTDTAAVGPAPTPTPVPVPTPTPAPMPTPVPVAPGSGGTTGVTPADTVSFSPGVTYADGVFSLSGTASSAAGVQSVEIMAQVNGVETDLGAATVNASGNFVFSDLVGANSQSFITATETDAGGGTASAQAPYSLQAGITGQGHAAEEDVYSADGSTVLSRTTFQSNGASVVNVEAPYQSVELQPFDIVENHRQADTSFVFSPGDGIDVIHGFKVGGIGHDTLDLPSSDFTSLAEVFRNTGDINGSAFITDPKTGDAIRLAGVTTAELKAHPKDIAFHA